MAKGAKEKSGGVEESRVEGRRRESVGGFDAGREWWEGREREGKYGDVGVYVRRKVPVEERGVGRGGDETDGEMAVVGREEAGEVDEGDGVSFCHERDDNNVIFCCHGSNLGPV